MAGSSSDRRLEALGLDPGALATPTEVAVLAGAGISLSAPSNLLPGATFTDELLKRLVPEDIDAGEVEAALAIPELARPGEGIRFEQLMAMLADCRVDRGLRVLDCLDQSESPNYAHHLLATLARSGATVMTVNLDRLVEVAFAGTSADGEEPLRVAAYDEDFADADLGARVLWKLHGSLSVGGEETRDSIQATLPAVLARGMSVHKRSLLRRVVAERDLLVVGYSGWDDFDVVPVLASAGSRRIVWVHHRGDVDPPRVRPAADLAAEHHARSELDAVAFQRMLLAPPSEHMTVIEGDTTRVLEMLAADWFPAGVPTRSYPDYELDAGEYFDSWSAGLGPPARRYVLLEQLLARRAFRAEVRPLHEAVAERAWEECSRPEAEPYERLLVLLEAYNTGEPPKRVQRELRKLRLEPEDTPLGARLDAHLSWTIGGPSAGIPAFERAAQIARDQGDATAEFLTLLGWLLRIPRPPEIQLWWAEGEEARVNELGVRFLEHPPPDLDRMAELVRATGRQIDLWQTALDLRHGDSALGDLYAIFIEAISGELTDEEWRHELSTMTAVRRHSIDVGDVIGEARASLVLGGMYLCLHRPRSALPEFFRVLELSRIAEIGEPAGWARVHARHAIEWLVPGEDFSPAAMTPPDHPDREEDARLIRAAVQESMWGRTDLGPAPGDD